MNSLILIAIFALIFGGAFTAIYFLTPLQTYLTPMILIMQTVAQPFTPYIEMVKPYLTNPALLMTLIPAVATIVYAYIRSKAEAKVQQAKIEATTQIEGMQSGLINSANQVGQLQEENKMLRSQLDNQNLTVEQVKSLQTQLINSEKEIQRLKDINAEWERVQALKSVIIEERVH